MTGSRTPILLLTGFLGSGKTTLLNQWLRTPSLADAAVIVNEFGDIGIDGDLIAASDESTIELTTGCLCCTVRGDLVETLQDLVLRQRRGDIRTLSRVVIETTGLADPAPVIQALMTMPVARDYRLDCIVTAVEAPQGLATLDRHAEAVKQAAVADAIVVTKTDLAPGGFADLAARLRSLNPGASLLEAAPGAPPDPAALVHGGVHDGAAGAQAAQAWLRADAFPRHGPGDGPGDGDGPDAHDHHARHDAAISSFCLTFDEPLVWQEVAAWLDALVIAHGEDMLRIKGILDVEGRGEPIVVQAVQKLFHPPFALDAWPRGWRRSRIVFITRGIPEPFVREVFDVIRSARSRAPSASLAI
ncbi:GTP-binding protein [Arenibaculum sp.]|jgi:G3E family GTPase|uniref:CobW family GTP-binding protein n=1 Tax=Arenibaculum sp. TaxID=2865862 RepID=UPI002E1525D8|nr:GTP-binding protein [Arenibaculum sp.]